MIVKMLTYVHLLVYTLWCWHTLRRRWSLKCRERMGPALFEKMKCIFFIAPVGNLEKSRTLDAESERPVQTVPGPARVRHQTIGTGRWLERPVVRVRCAGVLQPSLRMSPVSTGRVRCGLA